MSRFLDEAGLQAYHTKLEERLGSKLNVYQSDSSGSNEMLLEFNYHGLHLSSNSLCASATLNPNYVYISEGGDEYQTVYRTYQVERQLDYGNTNYILTYPDKSGTFALTCDVDTKLDANGWETFSGYLRYFDGSDYEVLYRKDRITMSRDTNQTTSNLYFPEGKTGTLAVASTRASSVTINSASSTSSRYYPIEINTDGTPFVNVPWTDTKVSYTSTTTSGSYPLLFKYSTGSTTTSAGTRFNTSITANPSTGTITATKFKGDGSELVNISYLSPEGDNRSTATTPNDYFNVFKFTGIKLGTTIGLSDTYVYTMGMRSWADASGGDAHEFAFSNSGMYHRQGSSTSWGSWESFAVRSNRNMYEHLVSLTLGNSSTGYLKGTGTLQFRVITHRPASFITSIDAVHTLLQEAGNYLPCYCSYHITSNSSSNTYIGQPAYCYALLRVAGSDNYFLSCSGTYIKSNVPYIVGMTIDYMTSAVKVLKTIQI